MGGEEEEGWRGRNSRWVLIDKLSSAPNSHLDEPLKLPSLELRCFFKTTLLWRLHPLERLTSMTSPERLKQLL